MSVVVAGLGPAGPELLTAATLDAINRIPHRYLRTRRHPAAVAVADAVAFDGVYDQAATLEEVYVTIAEVLRAAAREHGEILYLVPGSPAVAERTVELLRAAGDVEVVVMPGVSFVDLAWDRLGIDPVAAGVRVIDGHRFAVEASGERGPLLVAQCDSPAVLSAIKLAVEGEPPDLPVTVLQRLGLPDESVTTVAWTDLDRSVEPDHLTTLFVPRLAVPIAGEVAAFAELVRTLRERCPWDREQTHTSLSRHLIEESYEVLDAIVSGDPALLEEELGDLLFQVVFHATLGAEEGEFTLADVARGIHDKLVRRHPHVFGDVDATTPGEVVANWEEIKKAEKGRASVMDGVPRALPSLLYAHKLGRKASSVGFDWEPDDLAGVLDKVGEELDELRAAPGAEELGDLLFAAVNVSRHLGVDPELALRAAADKFRDRFLAMEALAAGRGVPLSDALWDEVKAAE